MKVRHNHACLLVILLVSLGSRSTWAGDCDPYGNKCEDGLFHGLAYNPTLDWAEGAAGTLLYMSAKGNQTDWEHLLRLRKGNYEAALNGSLRERLDAMAYWGSNGNEGIGPKRYDHEYYRLRQLKQLPREQQLAVVEEELTQTRALYARARRGAIRFKKVGGALLFIDAARRAWIWSTSDASAKELSLERYRASPAHEFQVVTVQAPRAKQADYLKVFDSAAPTGQNSPAPRTATDRDVSRPDPASRGSSQRSNAAGGA
jgi:hypothetical protein